MNPRITANEASLAAGQVITVASIQDRIYGDIYTAMNQGAFTLSVTVGEASEAIRSAITQNFQDDGYTTGFDYFNDGRGFVFNLTWPQL